MSHGALIVLDGTHLRGLDFTLPNSDITVTGAQVLELVESKASATLFGVSLPENIRLSALKCIGVDDELSFRQTELGRELASKKLSEYLIAIADGLQDDPLAVTILDGMTLRLYLEDEDDFAMLAENLFTDLDAEDKGKIIKSEIRTALAHMGVEMGIPPFSEFPLLNDILKKHGAEGEGEVGQSQFAQLLQPVLQELADTLSKSHVVVIQNIKINNGSKLKKLLANEKKLNDVVEKILQKKLSGKDERTGTEVIKCFLEENGMEVGLPPAEANEAVVLLYDVVFAEVRNVKSDLEVEKDEFRELVKEILTTFAEQLEANPVFHDLDN